MSDISIPTRLRSLAVGETTTFRSMTTIENIDFSYDPTTTRPVSKEEWAPVASEIAASGVGASLLFLRVRQAIRHDNGRSRNDAIADDKTHYLVRGYALSTRTECKFFKTGMRIETFVIAEHTGSTTRPVSMPVPDTIAVSE